MTPETISILVALLAVIIAGYAIYRSGQAVTVATVSAALGEAQPLATELSEVALTAVQASEQLYRTGRIEKTERLDRAFRYVSKWYPDLDQARIITAIEAGVWTVRQMTGNNPESNSYIEQTGPPAHD